MKLYVNKWMGEPEGVIE